MGTPARLLAFVLLLMSGVPALAEDVRPTPEAEHRTLESFAEANQACREWTDGCAVCLRHDDGTLACSLPGIACEPTPIVCRPPPVPPSDATPPKDGPVVAPKETPKDAGAFKPVDPPKDTSGDTPPAGGAPPSETPKPKDPP